MSTALCVRAVCRRCRHTVCSVAPVPLDRLEVVRRWAGDAEERYGAEHRALQRCPLDRGIDVVVEPVGREARL